MGLLVLIHVRNAGLVLALLPLALRPARLRGAPAAGAMLAGFAALLLVRTAINHAFWGTWITTPHAALGQPAGLMATAREAGIRLAGMAIDQEFGLLPYAPIMIRSRSAW